MEITHTISSNRQPSAIHSLDCCKSLSQVKQSHAQLLKTPTSTSLNLATKLVSSYAKFRDLDSALVAFHSYPQNPDPFLFNSLIQAHVYNSLFLYSIQIYIQMISHGVYPNRYTFPILFKTCSSSLLQIGIQLHAHAVKYGFKSNRFVTVGLIDMYMKNGMIEHARQLFDRMTDRDLVAWNAFLTGYSQNGLPEEALGVYNRMREAGVIVDFVAVASVIAACAQLQLVHQGSWVHSWVVKSGFDADVVVATALLDMYASSGNIMFAKQVFDEMSARDLVSWNCLVSCFSQNGLIEDALRLFVDMQFAGLKPNGSSLAGILPAVARSGALHLGKSCHGYAIRNGLDLDEFVMTALTDAYCKSGDLVAARQLFDVMPNRNVVAWSSMIAGYGTHGCAAEALALFEEMEKNKIKPNYITYIGILSACGHAGYVNEGKEHFRQMVDDHGIVPHAQHYTCMVDLLGRAGLLCEARSMIEAMPVEPSPGVWGALLGACRIHSNVELGNYAANRFFELNSQDPGFYVLLSNIYAAAGMWSGVREVRGLMKERGLRKPAGWSSIEIQNKVHCFISGDMTHIDSKEIYKKLEELMEEIKGLGYVPETRVVLHDVEEDVKANVLMNHSEKLAMAYGLLRTAPGTPIRIMKNLRTCEDCHSTAKFVSKLTSREIVLRDAVRFHHVKNGACTCRDYW